ncbi:hypothetical protein BLNAU_5748 [Blattamonas nauphoetae]|uniref:Uncharacterized protein n=1 Tax=Blattamonas nauphoetae TaxID=2049346 RepID=A0ABQ9Y620_9EUKA|nr:hypothetical protein BLNAU_5748 [Blattamonas nauphoetae]
MKGPEFCEQADIHIKICLQKPIGSLLFPTVVSTKYLDDQFFFNKHYAHLGGIAPTVFNDMERTLLSLLDYSLPFDVCHFEQLAAFCQNGAIRLVDRHETTFQSGNIHSVFFHIDAVFADRALQSVYSSQSASQRRPRTPQTRSAAGKLLDGPGRPQCHPADAPSHHRRTKSLDVAHYFYPLPPTLSYSLFRYRSCGSVQQTLSWGNNVIPAARHAPHNNFLRLPARPSSADERHPAVLFFVSDPSTVACCHSSCRHQRFARVLLPDTTSGIASHACQPDCPPHPNTADPAVLSASKARAQFHALLPFSLLKSTGESVSTPNLTDRHPQLDRTDAADVLRSSSAAPLLTHRTDEASSQPAEQKLPTTITVLGTQPASKPRSSLLIPDSQHVLDRPLSVVLPQAKRTPPTKQTTPSSPFVLPLPPLAAAEAPDVLKAPPLLTTPSPTPFTPLAPRPVLHPSRPSIAHQTRV